MATLTATQGEKLSLHCYYTSLLLRLKQGGKTPLHFPSPSFTFYTAYFSVYGFHTCNFQRKHTQKLFIFTQAELSGSGVWFFRLRQETFRPTVFAFCILDLFPSTKCEKYFRLESNILLPCSLQLFTLSYSTNTRENIPPLHVQLENISLPSHCFRLPFPLPKISPYNLNYLIAFFPSAVTIMAFKKKKLFD